MSVDLETDQFTGSVTILVDVSGATLSDGLTYITLNAASTLQILSSAVTNAVTRAELPVVRAFAYQPYAFWVVQLATPVKTSQLELTFTFTAKLSTDMAGFYSSAYYDPATQQNIKLAATQFQATDARRAFPCFDEPSFKSVFGVSLTYNQRYTSTMSNGIILRTTAPNAQGLVTRTFDDSPKMVTYLLAFVVSDFVCEASQTTMGIDVHVCATPPQRNMLPYSQLISPHLLERMELKYDYLYEIAKMDLVAIPDFSAGAMENWGLLTFRETALLWRADVSSAADKMRVASVVAHEIAHMVSADPGSI